MAQNDGELSELLMEDAQILFRNFQGKEGMYNAEGDRNFCILLDTNTANQMRRDGWNVKQLKAREEGDTPQDYLQVSVKYRGRNGAAVRPPVIVMVSSKGRTALSEDECEILDWVDIANVDLIVRPFGWAVNGKSGVKAYLKAIYITIAEDALQLKYQDLPELRGGPKAIGAGPEEEIWDAEVVENEQLSIGR